MRKDETLIRISFEFSGFMMFVMFSGGVRIRIKPGVIVKVFSNVHLFSREVYLLLKSPVFLMLTFIGNSVIGLSGMLFFLLEKGANPRLHHFIDALWWSFSTATTTGYGDITPVTTAGKVLGIFLMLMGTALFAMYTGLFAEIILTTTKRRH